MENSTKDQEVFYEINNEFSLKNVFIEVSSENKKCFETLFSNNLMVTIAEDIGHLKVMDNNFKPLCKVQLDLNFRCMLNVMQKWLMTQ